MPNPTSGANDDGAPAPLLDIDPTDQPAPPSAPAARVNPDLQLEQVIQRTNPQAAAPLQYQVAGHQNVMSDESGSLVIKPGSPREVAFYHLVAGAPRKEPISDLEQFLPKFYGTLQLSGKLDTSGKVREVEGAEDVPENVVLENLAYPFSRPCILDAKLGTALHGPDATEEKAARMAKKAEETTSGATGLRWTGSQTWHEPSQAFIQTPREYGYNLTADALPDGMVRYFPLPSDEVPHIAAAGVVEVREPYTAHALPPAQTARLLSYIDEEVGRIEAALSRVELRAVGMSVLIVYEGDPARLGPALDRYEAKRVSRAAKGLARDESDDDDDVGYLDNESVNSDDSDEYASGDDAEPYSAKADARAAKKAPALSVKLIDFAHTWMVKGEGADQGVLKGIATLRALLQGRLKQVQAWIEVNDPKDAKVVAEIAASREAAAGGSAPAPAQEDKHKHHFHLFGKHNK
ncbi:hypothetical protein Q8F55_001867 [Vanrija albida]|uniref:Kinase n=1 Tax=Vanrija albida TaxID=181172 RepID=A0ABR3Q865_9TREE